MQDGAKIHQQLWPCTYLTHEVGFGEDVVLHMLMDLLDIMHQFIIFFNTHTHYYILCIHYFYFQWFILQYFNCLITWHIIFKEMIALHYNGFCHYMFLCRCASKQLIITSYTYIHMISAANHMYRIYLTDMVVWINILEKLRNNRLLALLPVTYRYIAL